MHRSIWAIVVVLCLAQNAFAQATSPAGAPASTRPTTARDVGPDIDPEELLDSRFRGLMGSTFNSLVSSSFAMADVWIYAAPRDAQDAQALDELELEYTYPRFYRPTWREVFDHVARQMRGTWEWDTQKRQFRFQTGEVEPFFGVKLADGWRREDRGLYVWHAPRDQDFGMDFYYFGHFTADPDLFERVRVHFAEQSVSRWPDAPKASQMKLVKVGERESLYLKIDTPRPGGVWRQWSMVIDGHAFVIVSAMPKDKEAALVPAVEQMVSSFTLK